MKRLMCLTVAALTAAWGFAAPKTETPKGEKDYQDIVHFADKRPVLLRLHVTVDGRPLAAIWNDYVSKVFEQLDTDKAGFLDQAKVQRMPSVNELFGGDYDSALPTLAKLDTNGDGKVSREELAGYFRSLGATAFQAPGAARRGQPDNNFGGFIILSGGGGGAPDADAVNAALFKLLDSNGDGKLSKEELAAAPAVLLKLDRNDDEMITSNEIIPGGRAQNNDGNLAFAIVQRAPRRDQDNDAFWQLQDGTGKAELARRLQRYAKKDAKGKAAAKLSRTDLGLDEATFAKLDADRDGLLDTEELSHFADRTPDLELKVDLGKKATVQVVKRGLNLESQIRTGKNGVLTLEMIGARIDLKALAAAKTEVDQLAKVERAQYLQAFKRADRDNNGYVDMTEAMRTRSFRTLFKVMDRDGDGMLYLKEVEAYLDAFQGLRATAGISCATVGLTSEGKGLLELLDTDGDGRLSVRELRNAGKVIADLDRDRDGMLSRVEIPRCSQATFRLGSPTAGPRGPALDGNVIFIADGNPFGQRQQQPMRQPRGPEWFRKMDRNGDGDVSRREFLGTDAQFKAIDTDGDGLISVEEAEAFEKTKQPKK